KPAAPLPRMQPLRDALHDVDRVRIELHPARPLERLQGADGGGQLHAVVRGLRLAAVELLFHALRPQQRAPAARPRVALARAVAVDLDDLAHGFWRGVLCVRCVTAATARRRARSWRHAGVTRRMPCTRFTARTT